MQSGRDSARETAGRRGRARDSSIERRHAPLHLRETCMQPAQNSGNRMKVPSTTTTCLYVRTYTRSAADSCRRSKKDYCDIRISRSPSEMRFSIRAVPRASVLPREWNVFICFAYMQIVLIEISRARHEFLMTHRLCSFQLIATLFFELLKARKNSKFISDASLFLWK